MLLPQLKLKGDIDFKHTFSIKSHLSPMEEPTMAEEGREVHFSSEPSASILHKFSKPYHHHQRCVDVKNSIHLHFYPSV